MSGSATNSLTFDLNVYTVGLNNRRLLTTARPSVDASANLAIDKIEIAPAGTRTFTGIVKSILVRCNGPLNIAVAKGGNTTVIAVTSLFVLTGALDSVVLTNAGADKVLATVIIA